jgi:hypothetical protein
MWSWRHRDGMDVSLLASAIKKPFSMQLIEMKVRGL